MTTTPTKPPTPATTSDQNAQRGVQMFALQTMLPPDVFVRVESQPMQTPHGIATSCSLTLSVPPGRQASLLALLGALVEAATNATAPAAPKIVVPSDQPIVRP